METTVELTEPFPSATVTEQMTKTNPASSSTTTEKNKYTSTEIRLIKKQKERIIKKEKLDEVVGKLFRVNNPNETMNELSSTSSESSISELASPPVVEKKKRKSKKDKEQAVITTTTEEIIKKEAYTNPQIDTLVENILTMTIAGQANLASAGEEEDELISLLKTKRRARFDTANSKVGSNVGPTTYKQSSIEKFTQQEVDFKLYTQTKESELSTPLEMSEEGQESFKAPAVDPEDEDILSYLRELKDRTLKQKDEEKKSNRASLNNDTDLDEEDKIVEQAWQDIASKPESAAKSVESELDEPVRGSPSKSSNNSNKKDDVIMQFLQDLLK